MSRAGRPGRVRMVRLTPELRVRLVIGYLVRSRRIALGWTQKKLATEARTTPHTISQLETAERGNIKFSTLDRITQSLGLEVQLIPDSLKRFSDRLKEAERAATGDRPGGKA